MTTIKKFKSDIGEDNYNNKVKDYALKKDVDSAIRLCEACKQLQFSHGPGPCTRSDKSDKISQFDSEQISEIIKVINNDIINKIVDIAQADTVKSDEPVNDRLATALDKISEVLEQRRPVHQQITKVKAPPIWAKEPFSDYKEEVQAWEAAHSGDEFSKYSEFLAELKKNKAKPGLSDYVSTIVVEKTRANKSVACILEALADKYELTKKEKFDNLINDMKNFMPKKADSGEKVFSQIERLETQFQSLKVGSNINYFLATYIIKMMFENEVINEVEKRMVEDIIESSDKKQIFAEVKKAIRKIKVEGKREKVEIDHEAKTFYSNNFERSRYGSWKNSRDFKDFSRTNSNNWRTKSGNRWRKSESNNRNGSRSQSRRSDSEFKSFKDLSQTISQVLAKLKSLEENQSKLSKIVDDKIVDSKFIETDFIEEDWSHEGMNIYFTKDITEANEMVADCGAPKTLIGHNYLQEYLKFLNISVEELEIFPCKQKFRFGPSQVYISTEKIKIPIFVQSHDEISEKFIETYVIQADVPFLLGLDTMREWRALIDMETEQMIFRSFDLSIKMLRNNGGHLIIPLKKSKEWSTSETVLFMNSETDVSSYEKIQKVHKNTNHKSEENMLHAYKQANLLTDQVRKSIKKVCENCVVCQKFKKSQSRPKVALPKVTDFNQVVTLDLKQFGEKFVLWAVDSFTRFIQGVVLKNKQAETVVEAIQTIWCLRFGYPSRGFWADNGAEFQNKESLELMSKLGLKIEFGPTYSPWSNGINERNHYSADIVVRKAQETDKNLSLQKAVDLASWTHNTNVSILGYEPMRLVTGKSVNIPGVTVGTEATDCLFDSEAVQKIMERHHTFIKKFREHEYSDKIKKAAQSRSSVMNNIFYKEGDEVFFQEKDKKSWLGPVKVFCQKGREVYLFANGNIKKVSSCKVKPFLCDLNVEKESLENDRQTKNVCINSEAIDLGAEQAQESLSAAMDATNEFDNSGSLDGLNDSSKLEIEKDLVGTYWMQVEKNECYNSEITTFVVELPVHQQNTQEVKMAKDTELKNLHDYGTFEEVADIGQDRITSRWVVTRKEAHDGQKAKIKARLVARGFQEEEQPLSDSPTVLRESNKLFTAVAANEGFSVVTVDIRAAFLQSKELNREVYVVPPKDIAKHGLLWKLKKPLYGLNDASRRFWLRVKEVFMQENLKTLPGDEAFYFKNENGNLIGMIITHVDDFQIAGNSYFVDSILDKLNNNLTVSKVERDEFRFTGIDVKGTSNGIMLSMDEYASSIEEIREIRKEKKITPLTKTEMKLYRKYVGKLNWLAENTRPDLAIWSLNLSKQNAKATIGDLKKVNQIVKKVQNRQSKVKFSVIGRKEDLVIHAVGDASYKCDAPSIGGNLIMLGNRNSTRVSPLYWKSKQIQNVCHSAKEAETRNILKNVDLAVYLSAQLSLLLFGESESKIPVKVYTDSKPLLDSIASSKQVEQKLLRNTMTDLKKKLEVGDVASYSWIETKAMTADVLTKEGGDTENILEVVRENNFRKANSQQNMVVFKDAEMLVINPLVLDKYFA